MRRTLLMPLILTALAGSSGVQAADPFLSAPGVAEAGVGGATVAGAGSLASVWHNPATLVDGDTQFVFEWQTAADRTRDGRLSRGANSWFAGASFVNRDKWYGTVATGIAAYTPHTMKQWVAEVGEGDTAFGRTNVTTQAIGVPYAVEFDRIGLAIGAVGELIAVDASGTEIRVKDAAGEISEAEVDDEQNIGFSGALGLRYRMYHEGSTRVDLAGVRRMRASGGASVDVDSGTAALLAPDKPAGWDVGLRWHRDLADQRSIAVSLHYGSTDWDDAGDMRRDAVGLTYRRPFGDSAVLRSGVMSLRAGFSRYRPDEAEAWMDWPRGRALSAGIGFDFDQTLSVDLVLQRRFEERARFNDQHKTFGGFNISLPF
jgi:hypothetical protein